jgi:hypothetical protein
MNRFARIFSVKWKKVNASQLTGSSMKALTRFLGAHGKKNSTIVRHVSAAVVIRRTSPGALHLGSRRGLTTLKIPKVAIASAAITQDGFADKLLNFLK